jgi:hypothetical protein
MQGPKQRICLMSIVSMAQPSLSTHTRKSFFFLNSDNLLKMFRSFILLIQRRKNSPASASLLPCGAENDLLVLDLFLVD